MKTLLVIVALVLAGCAGVLYWTAASSSNPAAKTAMNLTWDGPYAVKIAGSRTVPAPQGVGKSLIIQPQLDPKYPHFSATLLRIKNPPVGFRFALEGTISYTNLPDESALRLIACSLTKTETAVTDQDEGPQRKLSGTSGTRPFVIGYGELPGTGEILEVDLDVFIGGHALEDSATKGPPPSLTLSNLKLVRYPDPSKDDLAILLRGASMSDSGAAFNWKSFFLGAAASAIFGMAMAQAVLLMRRLLKMKAEREMRRMSSLDG